MMEVSVVTKLMKWVKVQRKKERKVKCFEKDKEEEEVGLELAGVW